ncbi:hypothetical protein C8R46DRAFT_1212808 [Mycena filopes]|nr:hypothetical protein C8R46DRAFT_1212808 [Mycena filopes]
MDTRPPPAQGKLPRGYFNRAYRTNLRPVVIGVSALSALWSLFSCIGFFRSISIDKEEGVPKLATFAIVLGAVYMLMFLIESFGVVSAASQRLPLVRTYAYMSFATILLTVGGGIFQVVVHFTSKSDILKECTELVGDSTAVYPFGLFGPSRHESIDPEDAAAWCKHEYDQNSWQDIVSLLITIFLACSFSVLAWGYYRQVLDPTSVINFSRAPSNQIRLAAFPSYNQQPYNASVPNLGYAAPYGASQQQQYAPQQYAPPPGMPPMAGAKAPGYGPGDAEAGVGYGHDDKENPFADFDERTDQSHPAPGR